MDKSYILTGALKPTLKRFADLSGPDFFPTPQWATYALMECEQFVGDVWEPACGDGSMSEVIQRYGNKVYSSDLYDRGYGVPNIDFLAHSHVTDNIITNPPYNSAEGFVKRGLEKSTKKLALLLRLAFLEGANRQKTIFKISPPSRIWVFSERITFYPAGAVRKGSGTTAYAWFVWDKDNLGQTELRWIPLGMKRKFENHDNQTYPMLFR